MLSEYKEPEIDWSKVKVDTPILVKRSKEAEWERRYFAKFEDGKFMLGRLELHLGRLIVN